LEQEHQQKDQQHQERYASLLAEKKEIEREKAEKLEMMHQQHELDKERRQ
jgi:hypothetical protein